jgi:hypothetical protein
MRKMTCSLPATSRYMPRTDHISGRIGRNPASNSGLFRLQVLVGMVLRRMEHKPQPRPRRRGRKVDMVNLLRALGNPVR